MLLHPQITFSELFMGSDPDVNRLCMITKTMDYGKLSEKLLNSTHSLVMGLLILVYLKLDKMKNCTVLKINF